MLTYILRRLAILVPTLLCISLLVFLMIYLVPGDPAQVMLGERANAETLAALRKEMGLDQPWYVQFGRFFGGLMQGDLGRSIRTHERISTEILQRFPATCELTFTSMILATVGGTLAGMLAAARRARFLDYLSMAVSTAGISIPIFWLGLMLMLLLAVYLPVFPISGRISPHIFVEPRSNFYLLDAILANSWRGLADAMWHLVLPAITLSTVPMAVIARMTRASLLEVLGEDYIRTARSKGLSAGVVLIRHAIKNAYIPSLTVLALQFGYLLGGAILTETIFAWPGLGRWLFLAVQARDFRAVQGGVLFLATLFILINLAADVLYAWLDPRIKYSK